MIARAARIVEVRRIKRPHNVPSHSARIVADGLDEHFLLTTPAEIAWAESVCESSAPLVVTVTIAEPST